MAAQGNFVIRQPSFRMHIPEGAHVFYDETLFLDGGLESLLTIPYESMSGAERLPRVSDDVHVMLHTKGKGNSAVISKMSLRECSFRPTHFCMMALVL